VASPPPESACNDGLDDDCDGLVDCADPDCGGLSCGAGCVCAGGKKKETDCTDMADNDGDNLVDCADVADCPVGTPCKYKQGQNIKDGFCKANATCG
jgi:hypothetical protein